MKIHQINLISDSNPYRFLYMKKDKLLILSLQKFHFAKSHLELLQCNNNSSYLMIRNIILKIFDLSLSKIDE